MTQNKIYPFYFSIMVIIYSSLLYLECFSERYIETYSLKYAIIWLFFLRTTFSIEKEGYLWNHWLWKLRLAVVIADYFFLFTSYNGAGIGGYLVVQMLYREKIRGHMQEEGGIWKSSFVLEIVMIILLTGIGMLGNPSSIYILGGIYAVVILRNIKAAWEQYLNGKDDLKYLTLSLSFLALCDTSIFLNFIWNREWIGNLIWLFYIPSQFLLAKYE